VTNHGNFNAVYNSVTAPNFGQFVGFLDRRDGAVIDFIDGFNQQGFAGGGNKFLACDIQVSQIWKASCKLSAAAFL
jgi:hypothetical protein